MILELKPKKIPKPLGPRLEASGDDRESKQNGTNIFSSQIVLNVLPGKVSIGGKPLLCNCLAAVRNCLTIV